MYIINLTVALTTALTLINTASMHDVCATLAQAVAHDAALHFGKSTGIFDSYKHIPAKATAEATSDGFTVRIETDYFDDRSHYSDSDIRSAFDELRLGGSFTTFLQDSEMVWEAADELEGMIYEREVKAMFAESEDFDPDDLSLDADVKRIEVNTAENRYDTEINIRIEGELF